MTDTLDETPIRSQTSLAYRQLRRDILAGRFQPGERLKVADLAAELDTRTGAVREALSRLVPEQLVVFRDQRGFVVAPLSVQDLLDLTDLRCEIEAIALRRSVERGTVEWESAIIASAHRLNATPRLKDGTPPTLNLEWAKYHQEFHHALVSACGNEGLLTLHGQLFERSERYRGVSVASENSARAVADEHNRIVKAALDRDTLTLIETVIGHIQRTTELIIQNAAPSALS
jgi:DNA-binding GntR family transcriptional regulator